MKVAELLEGNKVSIYNMEIAGPLPPNIICPCPKPYEDADTEFLTHDGTEISWKPQEEIDAIIAARQAAAEAAIEAAKSDDLKRIETGYCLFLSGGWTTLLRSKGLIAEDFTVTVANTNEATNTGYLFWLQQNDLPTYSMMYAVFAGMRTAVETLQKLCKVPIGLEYCKSYA